MKFNVSAMLLVSLSNLTLESISQFLSLVPTPRVTDYMEDYILQLDILEGQRSIEFQGMEEEWAPQERNCVDIVFGHFEPCYLRQCGAEDQSIILLLAQHQ